MAIPEHNLRLNLGCGRHVLDEWFNVDAKASPLAPRAPELLSDVRKIDLPDGCATSIMAIHVWEHFYRWECDDIIQEWRRLLRPRGTLIMEMPDLFKFCQNILDGRMKGGKDPDQLGMWGLYGDPRECDPLMVHRWGWTFATLSPFLERHGFTDAKELATKWHRAGRGHRDFRIEAVRT
jgi:hypothetical protein